MQDIIKKRFGLLGRNISYSFSKGYFTDKFKDENYKEYTYENFDIQHIAEFEDIIKNNNQELEGMNVTIPYKEAVMPFLDKLSKKAALIGAVNTI
jgi:shikimate dehydrogenase